MPITIQHNEAANCVNFIGASREAYYNACLTATVNATNPTGVDIANDFRFTASGGTFYEFFNIEYTEFRDEDGNSFASAADAVAYINANARFAGTQVVSAQLGGATTHIRNTLASVFADGAQGIMDPENTQPGWYYRSNGTVTDKINWYYLASANMQYQMTLGNLGCMYALVHLRADGAPFFNVYTAPQGDGNDAASWYRSRVTYVAAPGALTSHVDSTVLIHWGSDAGLYPTYNHVEFTKDPATTVGPEGADEAILFGSLSTSTNTPAGDVEFVAQRLGYVHNKANIDFVLDAVPVTEVAGDVVLDFQLDGTGTTVLISDGHSYAVNAIEAILADNGTITIRRPGGDVLYSGVQPHNVTVDLVQPSTNTGGTINALNSLFTVNAPGGTTVTPTWPTTGVASTFNLSGQGIDPVGTAIWSPNGSSSVAYGYSDETIDQVGEYFLVKMTGSGRFFLGLVDTANAADMAELTSGTLDAGHQGGQWMLAFYPYATYTAPWTLYGTNTGYVTGPGWSGAQTGMMRYNTDVQDDMRTTFDPVQFKVGIMDSGHLGVWYLDINRSDDWILCARTSYVLPQSDYALVVKMTNSTNVMLWETPEVHTIDATPVLTYRFIESPDGSFDYPLFSTIAQAAQYDLDNGGSGLSHGRTYVDDPSVATWYMPGSAAAPNGTVGGSSAPSGPAGVTWNRIHTLADEDFAPAGLTLPDRTVDEFGAVNYQLVPQDDTAATATGIPAGLFFDGYNLTGTAPEVALDNVVNPSDVYTITITRSNAYGSTVQTFDITVNNLTAPATAISGFTHVAGTALVDSDTMGDGSVVEWDNDLEAAKRTIIPQAWVEAYVLPALSDVGDAVYLGVKDSLGDLTDGIADSDWDAYIKWERTSTGHSSSIYADGDTIDSTIVNSSVDAVYDYAFEADDHGDLYVIACNVLDLNTEPGVDYGGQFGRVVETTGTAPFTLTMVTVGCEMDFAEGAASEITIPMAPRWIQVRHTGGHTLEFKGAADTAFSGTMPTLNAGYTYRFLMADVLWADQATSTSLTAADILKFTADGGSTEYTTGITRSGAVGSSFAYVDFAVPAAVPPLEWYNDQAGTGSLGAVTTSGSTYVVPVTGITLEGPAANQTGSNLFDDGDHGWLSIDEDLAAGERLVMDGTFAADLLGAMPNNSRIMIGLKDTGWANTQTGVTLTNFIGDVYYQFDKGSTGSVLARVLKSQVVIGSQVTIASGQYHLFRGFLEVSSGGGVVRAAWTTNTGMGSDEATTAYDDWFWSTKVATSGLSVTSAEVMVLGRDAPSGGATAGTGMDSADVDWTGLSEIAVPTPASTLTTSWTKALDFSGGAERAQLVSSATGVATLRMGGLATTTATATAGYTSSDTNARPWATAVVFSSDNNASNQVIWCQGEGSGSGSDNIMLTVNASRQLHLQWGREGTGYNQCFLGTLSSGAGNWYGIYIAHNGTRLSGNNASAANLAACFDIRGVNLSTGAVGSQISTTSNWSAGSGVRMDRALAGDFTVGGRGGNRNFHGKVASMVVTTLTRGVLLPTTAEVSMMVRDPQQWVTDYKVGNVYRAPAAASNTFNFQRGSDFASYATQVWLMGDTSQDAYAQIRNWVFPTTQNHSPLNMISMVSNDIQTVTISGLT